MIAPPYVANIQDQVAEQFALAVKQMTRSVNVETAVIK
jgi:hypothetical protein